MPAIITSFNASSSSVSIGSPVTLTPIFVTDGSAIILSGPTGSNTILQTIPTQSGVPLVVTPGVSTTYELVVTSADGSQTAALFTPITVTAPTPRKLSVTTGSGVVVPGTNDYLNNGPVFFMRVSVDPASISNNIAQTNESSILYYIQINDQETQPFGVVGVTNLNLVLGKFGLTWS